MVACESCSLAGGRGFPQLPAEGKRIMVISEAPTGLECRKGLAVQGQAGRLLRDLLENAGIDEDEIYYTYALRCPTEDKIKAKDLKQCKGFMLEEIERVKPEFILTLGATVLKVTTKGKITELHGQQLEYMGAKLMPTFHPGAALRDPARLNPLRKDIVKFGKMVNGEAFQPQGEIHWEVVRSLDTWSKVLQEIEECDEVALDIETTGLDRLAPGAAINTIQISLSNDKTYALPLSVRDGPWKDKERQRLKMVRELHRATKGKVIIGQNFKFDNLWIMHHYGVQFHLTFDTMLASHTLDENRAHGLKELAGELLDAPSYDLDLKTKLGLGDLDLFYEYGCKDTHYTLGLYRIFRKQLLRDSRLRRLFYKLVMPAARMFTDIEDDGHCIDMEKLDHTEMVLSKRRSILLKELNAMAGREVNWNAPAQVGKLFYEELKLPILERTPAGAPSTSESVLLRLKEFSDVAEKLVEYRGIEKNLSTYVVGWRKLMHSDRLYMSTKLHGTVTGRYSSRLHQVPRDPAIRSHIIAPEGWTFVIADYSQIELRLAAHLSGDVRMKMIFQSGGDIHRETAAFILGKHPDDLTKEERKMAKAVNFGLLYGMSWSKLVIYARDNYGVDMTDAEAKAFRNRYFETYSALLPWHERQRKLVRAFGYVSNLAGRRRRLPGINSVDKGVQAESERQSINSPVQGFGSGDLKAMAMVEISEEFSLDEVRIKGEVHDSILMWVRTDLLESAIPQIKAIMEQPRRLEEFKIKLDVPLVADFEVGPWGLGKEPSFAN